MVMVHSHLFHFMFSLTVKVAPGALLYIPLTAGAGGKYLDLTNLYSASQKKYKIL